MSRRPDEKPLSAQKATKAELRDFKELTLELGVRRDALVSLRKEMTKQKKAIAAIMKHRRSYINAWNYRMTKGSK